MDATAAREELLERALAIDDVQFEQLGKMVIERAEQTRDLELTPFRGDGGIDVHAVIDRDLFHARLGVQTKQYRPGNTVGARTLRSFKGALRDQDYHIGTVITTSTYTSGAVESAERDYIRLIDGDRLTAIMVDGTIGVATDTDHGYVIDEAFWAAFETPEDTDIIPSLEVPQADSFDVLRHVLRAVLDGTWGTTDAYPGVVEPGQDFQHTYEYVVPEAYQTEQIQVVAFVSLFHPTDLTRREVLNARALNLTDMDLVSSRENLVKKEDWQLFPNPAKREVFIRFPESADPFEDTVSLLNAAGRPLYTAHSLPAGRRIDLGPYPPGLYLIRLDTRAGTSVRKLVIQH